MASNEPQGIVKRFLWIFMAAIIGYGVTEGLRAIEPPTKRISMKIWFHEEVEAQRYLTRIEVSNTGKGYIKNLEYKISWLADTAVIKTLQLTLNSNGRVTPLNFLKSDHGVSTRISTLNSTEVIDAIIHHTGKISRWTLFLRGDGFTCDRTISCKGSCIHYQTEKSVCSPRNGPSF